MQQYHGADVYIKPKLRHHGAKVSPETTSSLMDDNVSAQVGRSVCSSDGMDMASEG